MLVGGGCRPNNPFASVKRIGQMAGGFKLRYGCGGLPPASRRAPWLENRSPAAGPVRGLPRRERCLACSRTMSREHVRIG